MDFPIPDYPSKFTPNYWTLVGDWFRKVGGAHLRTLDVLPDALDLADWLMEEARRCEPRGKYPGTGYLRVKGMAREDIVDRAEECAAWLLKAPRFSAEQSAKGGTNSRRPKKLLMAYRALQAELERTGEVITLTEMAQRLGTSTSSLRRVRRQIASRYFNLAPSPQSLDELVSEIEDEFDAVPVVDEFDAAQVVDEFGFVSLRVMFDRIYGKFGLTREAIFAQTPDSSTPYSWTDEYMKTAA